LYAYRTETPEEGFARRSRGGKASLRKGDPQATLRTAYARYVRAWKVAARYLERHPEVKPVKVPDPATFASAVSDVAKLLKQQAKQPK
jgi:hypothetical protein